MPPLFFGGKLKDKSYVGASDARHLVKAAAARLLSVGSQRLSRGLGIEDDELSF